VQQQMSFLERPAAPGAAPVWAALDEAERAEIVVLLARLMAQTVAPPARRGEGDPGHE
jgi:hypothetical protein